MFKKLANLLESDTAGDPTSEKKWLKRTLRGIKNILETFKISLSLNSLRKYLKKLGYSLKVNKKQKTGTEHPLRDGQFRYIELRKQAFLEANDPIISIDAKKKEQVGNFANKGQSWCRAPYKTFDHDFPSLAQGRVTPFGVYDLQLNLAHIEVGTSHDTASFAVTAIKTWWTTIGKFFYPNAKHLLILADCGGSNGYRTRLWKLELQQMLADATGLSIEVCHYPPGCSKWNVIEHRVFSHISNSWHGIPLESVDLIMNAIATTRTSTGLQIYPVLNTRHYETGIKVDNKAYNSLVLVQTHSSIAWNYTIYPHSDKALMLH